MSSQTHSPTGADADADWLNPLNIMASDGAWATRSLPPVQTSGRLNPGVFGFSIPSDATIDGVIARVEHHQTTGYLIVDTVALVTTGAVESPNHASESLSVPIGADGFSFYGSETDLWFGSLTPADVNAPGFGLAVKYHNADGVATDEVFVDAFQLTVYYTPAGGGSGVNARSMSWLMIDEEFAP